ncbi:hypothetical protein Tco_1518437 [Tanacetum coccineum]
MVPLFKDIEKAKAQASEASFKAKVEACGSKAKLQASTKTLIVKIHVPIKNCVLGLAYAKTRDAIKGTDISKITRKQSKTGKHGHENQKSTKRSQRIKAEARKVKAAVKSSQHG